MRGIRLHETFFGRKLRKSQTSAEQRLWAKLRSRRLGGYKFVRQQPIGPYFVDFLCREHAMILEVDGATHSTAEKLAHDMRRTCFLSDAGFQVVRVTNDDVFANIEGVCETILAKIRDDIAAKKP
ncbi:endonuclease domain-containing protein [Methylocystis sp.]|uniref:endonuclease domain-containing protein n=1 Tax=Methylocystis sp. TaxID=1911079 RepID=UPI0027377C32|nr:DUF559 domain-containing protein [Methylocystis sp.]MDP3553589.1 DUF559 domain-containing protein [Methylocystis sp.]